MRCVHLLIKGKVQGVYYRASAKSKADALDIYGWIKNTAEGNVEAVAYGKPDNVMNFINWCRQGPVRADVEEVITEEIEPVQSFETFEVLR